MRASGRFLIHVWVVVSLRSIHIAGGVSRMSDPKMIKEIQDAVTIPVMAKVRIGHFVEAQV